MTEPTCGTGAVDARGSRAINQQISLESRFKDFLTGDRFLNIGSGHAPMIGDKWENVDGNPEAWAEHHFNLLEPWPLPDNTYDVVMASHVLEHFTGDELFDVIWEAGRVLKPGGHLAVIVPHGLHTTHYCNPFHKQAWTEGTPFQFNRTLYEYENTASTGNNQGKRLHAWEVSHMVLTPTEEWKNEPDNVIDIAKRRFMNVISEMTFVMTLQNGERK